MNYCVICKNPVRPDRNHLKGHSKEQLMYAVLYLMEEYDDAVGECLAAQEYS